MRAAELTASLACSPSLRLLADPRLRRRPAKPLTVKSAMTSSWRRMARLAAAERQLGLTKSALRSQPGQLTPSKGTRTQERPQRQRPDHTRPSPPQRQQRHLAAAATRKRSGASAAEQPLRRGGRAARQRRAVRATSPPPATTATSQTHPVSQSSNGHALPLSNQPRSRALRRPPADRASGREADQPPLQPTATRRPSRQRRRIKKRSSGRSGRKKGKKSKRRRRRRRRGCRAARVRTARWRLRSAGKQAEARRLHRVPIHCASSTSSTRAQLIPTSLSCDRLS